MTTSYPRIGARRNMVCFQVSGCWMLCPPTARRQSMVMRGYSPQFKPSSVIQSHERAFALFSSTSDSTDTYLIYRYLTRTTDDYHNKGPRAGVQQHSEKVRKAHTQTRKRGRTLVQYRRACCVSSVGQDAPDFFRPISVKSPGSEFRRLHEACMVAHLFTSGRNGVVLGALRAMGLCAINAAGWDKGRGSHGSEALEIGEERRSPRV